MSQPVVQVYDAATMELLFEITADRTFGVDYTGGVQVATGDLNGDGIPDIVVVPGRNMAPNVLVFSGIDGSLLDEYCIPASATYGMNFKDGLNVAVGDVNGTGTNDIILVPSSGHWRHRQVQPPRPRQTFLKPLRRLVACCCRTN